MDRFTIWSKVTSSTVWNWPSLIVSVLPKENKRLDIFPSADGDRNARGLKGSSPVDGVSWLAARVIADLDVTLVELHSNMIIVPIVQQDPVVLSC